MDELPADRVIGAAFNSLSALGALLDMEPHLISERTGLGETPLHYLAVENQLEAVQMLVARGAEINTVSEVSGTPLSEAASLGYEEMVDYLLASGAMLQLPGQREPTLHAAVRSGSVAIVRRLLAAGALPDEVDSLGDAALHIAAESDDTFDVLEILLRAGANHQLRRIFDETPLDVALNNGSARCAAALRERQPEARGGESA